MQLVPDGAARGLCGFKVPLARSRSKDERLKGTWAVSRGAVLTHAATCFSTAKPKSAELTESLTMRAALESSRGSSAKQVQSQLTVREGVDVRPWTIYRAKRSIQEEDEKNYVRDFQKIAAWCTAWEEAGNGIAKMEVDDENRFVSVTVLCFAAARRCKLGQDVFGVDGAHFKHSIYQGQLLALEGRDGDGKSVLIAFRICPKEDTENYEAFFHHLKSADVDAESFNLWINSSKVGEPTCLCMRVCACA